MPPKISKTKDDAKGKGKVGKSSTTIENPFSLVSSEYVDAFEEKHKSRLVVKLYVWKANVIADLNLPKVTDLVAFQKVDYFLQLA